MSRIATLSAPRAGRGYTATAAAGIPRYDARGDLAGYDRIETTRYADTETEARVNAEEALRALLPDEVTA
jgi:hypothetical protein